MSTQLNSILLLGLRATQDLNIGQRHKALNDLDEEDSSDENSAHSSSKENFKGVLTDEPECLQEL